MLGKTHMVIGVAAGLAVCQPHSLPEIVLGAGFSAVGALISDIDVDSSKSHREMNKIIVMTVAVAVAMVVLEQVFHIGMFHRLMQDSNRVRMIVAALAFLGICAFGKEQPHRSFMHSILALVLLSGCIGILSPLVMPYFAVGFASHMAIDLLNHKKVRLAYPLSGGVCFGVCHARGLVNMVLFMAGTVIAAVEVIVCALKLS